MSVRISFTARCAARIAAASAAVLTLGPAVLSPSTATAPVRAEYNAAVELVATQAAITMNGTFTPDVTPEFMAAVMDAYIVPLVGAGYTGVPLRTPEALWPLSGLDTMTYNESTRVGYQILDAKYREIVAQNIKDGAPNTPQLIFGYSQSAFIASLFDKGLSDEMNSGGFVPPTQFILVGNTNIPNGGLMSRFGGLGLTPWTPVIFAPTKTGSTTYDTCRQYDPFCDFPAYPLDMLSVVNTLAGYLLHFTLPVSGNPPWMNPIIKILNALITPISLNPTSPNYVKPIVSTYEDTIYEFVPTAKLPILQPLYLLHLDRLANALDPVLRPLIEVGYARSVSFGVPTPASFRLPPNMGAAIKQSLQALRHMINPAVQAPTATSVGLASTAAAAQSVSVPVSSPTVAAHAARAALASPPAAAARVTPRQAQKVDRENRHAPAAAATRPSLARAVSR